MVIRQSVQDFIDAGPLLDSDTGTVQDIKRLQDLLKAIEEPVSDEEAQALVYSFGPDTCFGLAWTLMHLIETAPGAMTAQYPKLPGPADFWTDRLNRRVANVREDESRLDVQ